MTASVFDPRIQNNILSQVAVAESSHAYLVSGAHRNEAAQLIAQSAVCAHRGTPCLVCTHCDATERRCHVDVRWVEAEGSSIRLDLIRRLRQDIWLRPITAHRKVYVIVEADKLTDEAANALLKVLEEPPDDALLILTTGNLAGILATIRSRCQLLRTDDGVVNSETHASEKQADKILAVCCSGDLANLMTTSSELFEARNQDSLSNIIMAVISKLKKMMLAAEDRTVAERVTGCMDYCSRALQLLDRNANPRLCLDALLIKLASKLAPADKILIQSGGEQDS